MAIVATAPASDVLLRLYREIVAKATDAIGIVGPDGAYIEQNAAHRALTGYDDADLVGRTPEIHLGKEVFSRVLGTLVRDGEFRGEVQSRRKDGSLIDVELVAFTLRDASGAVACHVGIKRDIGRRKHAEAAFIREVARLKLVHDLGATVARAEDEEVILHAALASVEEALDADRAAVLLFDASGVMRFRAWKGLSDGYRAKVEGHSPWARDDPAPTPLLVSDVRSADLGALKDVVLGEGIAACAFVPLLHQGRLLGKFMAYYDAPHVFTPDEIRLSETIAQHVSFAVARGQAKLELETSRASLQDFVETSAIGLHWVGPDGIILWANPADHELLGYAHDEYVGMDIRRFHADSEVIADILARLTRGERITEYPARLLAKDGSIRHVLIDSSVRWEDGKFLHTRCFTRDVTARRQVEEELASARRQLAVNEKLSALGTLVSGVAHEIRTPLTYVLNNVHLARDALARGDSAKGAAYLGECIEGVERIKRLVGDLRRFNRHPLGIVQPEDPVAVVREAVDLFRATQRGRVRVVLEAKSCPSVALDRVQIQQVVLNLLDNAAEASNGAGEVRISVAPEGSRVVVLVADDGPGVAPEIEARIFEPFVTTKADGTGLGLSIVRRIVEGHGGTVRCETVPGRGATFRVALPVRPAAG